MNTNSSKSIKKKLRSKYAEEGFGALTEKEIIELVLSYSYSGDINELAGLLTAQFGSLNALIDADMHFLESRYGLDEKTVVLLRLIPQLSRIYFTESSSIRQLDSSCAAVKFFENYFIGALGEQFAAACTDEKFTVKDFRTIFCGSVSAVNVSCRELADFCLKNNSTRIFISHNHPLGSASPSGSDYAATDMIFRALEKLGIVLVDHIIVGKHSAVSMRELPGTMQFKSVNSGYIVSFLKE